MTPATPPKKRSVPAGIAKAKEEINLSVSFSVLSFLSVRAQDFPPKLMFAGGSEAIRANELHTLLYRQRRFDTLHSSNFVPDSYAPFWEALAVRFGSQGGPWLRFTAGFSSEAKGNKFPRRDRSHGKLRPIPQKGPN